MARKKPTRKQEKGLIQTAAVLAATALAEKAIKKAAEDPRVRRKVKAAGMAITKRVKSVSRKVAKRIKKRR